MAFDRLRESKWTGRATLLVFGAILVIGGAGTLHEGGFHYSNYWGGAVFAPFAIVIGIALWLILAWNWNTLDKRPPRLRGKAARLARQAEKTRFPIDDFDKPWNP